MRTVNHPGGSPLRSRTDLSLRRKLLSNNGLFGRHQLQTEEVWTQYSSMSYGGTMRTVEAWSDVVAKLWSLACERNGAPWHVTEIGRPKLKNWMWGASRIVGDLMW